MQKPVGMKTFLVVTGVLVLLAAAALWLSPGGGGHETTSVGASGTNEIHALDTITGLNDGNELVGRQVELREPIAQHINDVAFWVGPADNPLLVVLSRDTRDGHQRQAGDPSNGSMTLPQAGQLAIISGKIERLPRAEAMVSWGLTNPDYDKLLDRPVYLKATRVEPVQAASSNGVKPLR